MVYSVTLTVTFFFSLPAPDVAEIVEQSEAAARVTLLERSTVFNKNIKAEVFRAEVKEKLWGDLPGEITLWVPASACGSKMKQARMVVGCFEPSDSQRKSLQLPRDVYLLCGAKASRPGLPQKLKLLRASPNQEGLINMLDSANEPDAALRQQAFRQLRRSLRVQKNQSALTGLLHSARQERDPRILTEYLATFRHFNFRKAAPFVLKILLTARDENCAAAAERAFLSVAGRKMEEKLISRYPAADRDIKARILQVAAHLDSKQASALIRSAIQKEGTTLAALRALDAAGKKLPSELPQVQNSLLLKRIEKFLRKRKNRISGGQ